MYYFIVLLKNYGKMFFFSIKKKIVLFFYKIWVVICISRNRVYCTEFVVSCEPVWKIFLFCFINFSFNWQILSLKIVQQTPPPPRIATFKLLKGCQLGFGNLKNFLQKFDPPQKNLYSPPALPPQRMPLGVFGVKKWQSWGGEFAVNFCYSRSPIENIYFLLLLFFLFR